MSNMVSKSRVDRHYLSPNLLTGAAPRLLTVSHLPPTSEPLRHMRGSTSHRTAACHAATMRPWIPH